MGEIPIYLQVIKMTICDCCGINDPNLYYYWDAPLEERYVWRDHFPNVDAMCEICFDIADSEHKIKWDCDS